MAHAMVKLKGKQGVKSIGLLGYTDADGEQWLKAITTEAEKSGMKIIAAERFARADTSVTAQALKLSAANPDAMLVETMGPTPFAHGTMHWTRDNHWGYTLDTGQMLVVKNGDWALAN